MTLAPVGHHMTPWMRQVAPTVTQVESSTVAPMETVTPTAVSVPVASPAVNARGASITVACLSDARMVVSPHASTARSPHRSLRGHA
jgi:hypothetical protein